MSATASASICYGLRVRAADLLAAGLAFEAVGPTVLAVELIKRRRISGTLFPHYNAPISAIQVPVEVWDLVRTFTIRLALVDARQAVLERAHCEECARAATKAVFDELANETLRPDQRAGDYGETEEESILLDGVDMALEGERAEFQRTQVWHETWIDQAQPDQCEHEPPLARLGGRDQFWSHELKTEVR